MVFNFQPLKEMLDRHCKIPGIILFCKSLHSNLVAKTVARLCVTGFCGHIVAFLFFFLNTGSHCIVLAILEVAIDQVSLYLTECWYFI